MRKTIITAATVVAAALAGTGASAQFGALLGKTLNMPASGEAAGAYQSNNQIRTYVSAGAGDPTDLYAKVIVKAGEMTREKGFPVFGVTKYNCSTMLQGGTPMAKGCYVIAIMLRDGEEATPRGKRNVQYYRVEDVLAGRIARPEE